MTTRLATLALALAAPAVAFQSPATKTFRPSVAAQMSLRDIASYSDDMKMMSEYEAFDRNGALSRSQMGGMGGRPEMGGRPDMMYQGQGGGGGGRPDMMYQGQGGGGGQNPNPFSRRGNDNDRMYTRDGFDPYSAYGNSMGMSQSDRRGGGRGGMGGPPMDYYGGGPDMVMGGGGMNVNGVKADNTMGGFSYSSRNREYENMNMGGGPPMGGEGMMGGMGGGMPYEYEQGMMGGGGFDGPMGGMDYDQGGYGGGYGGFDGDMSQMGP